jgi:hypothetical protein
MSERPILFLPALLPAILDGRKTQTRRIIKPQPILVGNTWTWPEDGRNSKASWADFIRDPSRGMERFCPYGHAGDRLWIKEPWQYYDWDEDGRPKIRYRLDDATAWCDPPDEWTDRIGDIWVELSEPVNYNIDRRACDRRWRSPMFMPRWACRTTLEIVNVRVERVQDISEDDARAEGVDPLFTEAEMARHPDLAITARESWTNYLWHGRWGKYGMGNAKSDAWPYQFSGYKDPRLSYSSLWEAINGPGSWDANPWVWAITFRRVTR